MIIVPVKLRGGIFPPHSNQGDPAVTGKRSVKPFHLFEHRGVHCLINVEDMTVKRVDSNVADMLASIQDDVDHQWAPAAAEILRSLKIITDGPRNPRKKVRPKPVPVTHLTLFLTQSCNLDCVYCYGGAGEYGNRTQMSEATAFRSVDWLIAQSGDRKEIKVAFFGGEPLLNFPLMKAVAGYGKRKADQTGKKLKFTVVTNGTLLDDEKIDFLCALEMTAQISLDGSKEIHDMQRPRKDGGGSHDAVVRGIRKLVERDVKVQGHAVVLGRTDPRRVVQALQEVGLEESLLMPVSMPILGENGQKLGVCERDMAGFTALAEQQAEAFIDQIRDRNAAGLKRLKSISSISQGLEFFLNHIRKRYPCDAGRSMAAVSCDGSVYLCHRFVGLNEYKLGDVFHGELDRLAYAASPPAFVPECADCFAGNVCAGGCKYDNLGLSGSIFKPAEDMCRLRKRETEMAAYVAARMTDEDRRFLVDQKIISPRFCPLDFG